jgi:cation:H+ antiporter
VAATLAALALSADGRLGRLEGLLLVAGFVVYMVVLARGQRVEPSERPTRSPRRDALELVGGLVAVVVGAQVAVDAGVELAGQLGVPGAAIGVWLGVGTSLPELRRSRSAT